MQRKEIDIDKTVSVGPFLRPTKAADHLDISVATLWRWVKEPNSGFPAPIKLGPGTTVFSVSQLDAFVAHRAAQQ